MSFNIPNVPLVVSFASDLKNCVESKLSNNCEFIAVPWNNAPATVDDN